MFKSLKKDIKNKIPITIAILFCAVFTLLIFGPSEIIGTNATSFRFGITDVIGTLMAFAVSVLIITGAIVLILPEKIWKVCILMALSGTVGAYVQAMFLNSSMESLLGQEITFSRSLIIINIIIWFVLFLVIFLVGFLCEKWEKILGALACILVAIQMLALVSLLINAKPYDEVSSMLTDKGTFELSKDNNVIVFILDTVDGRVVDTILDEQPGYLDDYDGFTYYPNCTSVYSRTYPSIPYLLTDQKCEFDIPYDEWIEQSYEKSDFLDSLYNNDVNIGIYTNSQYVCDSVGDEVYNYYSGKRNLNYKSVIKQSVRMILYRDMPYVAKSFFEYNPDEVEKKILWLDEQAHVNDDQWYEDRLEDNVLELNIEKPTFRFYHLAAYHHGWNVDNAIKAFDVTKAYIRQMKELGIYDSSTIIIMADHGYSGAGETLDMPHKTAVPLMLVKKAGDSEKSLVISDAPVSQTEFEPEVLKAYGISCDKPAFEDIEEGNDRDRYYYSALYSDEDGEVELREYSVKGDARYPENYVFTGNVSDIIYSENTVKKK